MVSFFGTETSPSSGVSSPTIIRNSVVLPAPLGPTRPTFSPGFNWNDASTKRICRPYCLPTRVKAIIGSERPGLPRVAHALPREKIRSDDDEGGERLRG